MKIFSMVALALIVLEAVTMPMAYAKDPKASTGLGNLARESLAITEPSAGKKSQAKSPQPKKPKRKAAGATTGGRYEGTVAEIDRREREARRKNGKKRTGTARNGARYEGTVAEVDRREGRNRRQTRGGPPSAGEQIMLGIAAGAVTGLASGLSNGGRSYGRRSASGGGDYAPYDRGTRCGVQYWTPNPQSPAC